MKIEQKKIKEFREELMEELADIEHQRWADWQKYCHSKLKYSEYIEDGKTIACYIMDAGDYEHWQRQIESDYSELSEKEKDSDRDQVERYLPIIESFLLQTIKETREEVCKELIPEEREFPNTPVKWQYHGNGYRECRQEIINKAKKLK